LLAGSTAFLAGALLSRALVFSYQQLTTIIMFFLCGFLTNVEDRRILLHDFVQMIVTFVIHNPSSENDYQVMKSASI
jgi:hypothetical protein